MIYSNVITLLNNMKSEEMILAVNCNYRNCKERNQKNSDSNP